MPVAAEAHFLMRTGREQEHMRQGQSRQVFRRAPIGFETISRGLCFRARLTSRRVDADLQRESDLSRPAGRTETERGSHANQVLHRRVGALAILAVFMAAPAIRQQRPLPGLSRRSARTATRRSGRRSTSRPHGAKNDADGSMCQACHGDATEHLKDPMKAKPANPVRQGPHGRRADRGLPDLPLGQPQPRVLDLGQAPAERGDVRQLPQHPRQVEPGQRRRRSTSS